jgi:peptidoglycan hydrolase-like protein with peptidoglycan-binding domain
MAILKNGSRGDDVLALQKKLNALGYGIDVDGVFGGGTEKAVIDLQTLFNYTVDGLVGEGTMGLIDAQIGYGWNVNDADAAAKAAAANPAAKK